MDFAADRAIALMTTEDRNLIKARIKTLGWRNVRWEGECLKADPKRRRKCSMGDEIRVLGFKVPVSGIAADEYAHVTGRSDGK